MRFPYIAVACCATLVACAAPQQSDEKRVTVSATAVAVPTAAPTATSTLRPVVRESATPRTTTTPATTAPPTQTPSPVPVSTTAPPLSLPPDAAPHIVNLSLNKTDVQAGDTVSGTILTSSNVASVEARIGDYSIDVPKVAPGKFALSYTVPSVPFFLRHGYDMVVIARNTAGDQTTRTVPITIH